MTNPARFAPAPAVAMAIVLAACAPTLDWREVRPADAGVVALMPCRPSTFERQVRLAGREVALGLQACNAGGVTWALAWADMVDPALVSPALRELTASARANVGGAVARSQPFAPAGATPNPASLREAIAGKLPDGKAIEEQVAVFSVGTRVFQATVVAPRLDADHVDTFFGGLRAGT